MKREFLESLDLGEGAKLPKAAIDAIMSENGKDIEATKKPFADYETVKNQLVEANKAIEGFKAMDVDGVKKAAEEWKQKAERAEKDAASKIANVEFNAILGMLAEQLDDLKTSKNQEADIKTALESLKKDNSYMFDGEKKPPIVVRPTGGQTPEVTKDKFQKMGYLARIALKREDPEQYKALMEDK